jgi:hypothetical protein
MGNLQLKYCKMHKKIQHPAVQPLLIDDPATNTVRKHNLYTHDLHYLLSLYCIKFILDRPVHFEDVRTRIFFVFLIVVVGTTIPCLDMQGLSSYLYFEKMGKGLLEIALFSRQ